ncbi:MAG: purine-binding chemotaxis protein CheW [Gammaproteobacteria bacterium]|nr:purine-binding chemotaxis protein CheW [Gammaproteobacteria bacterium]
MTAIQETINESATMQAQVGTDQYLTFMLAGEEYGVEILSVQEIKGWDSATPIPNTPPHVLGVINLRGTVVPIIDLRRRFNMDSIDFGPTTVVIVLKVRSEQSERTMGIVVDAVSEVYNVMREGINPPPDFGGHVAVDFIKGLANVDGKMVILLDIDRLLATTIEKDLAH